MVLSSGGALATLLLWVDGEALDCASSNLDCATWFCETCPYAGVCDAHCGYVVDCDGKYLLDEFDCRVASTHFEHNRCSQWIGNGCCDDGRGYASDSGKVPNFNCSRFEYDGGDCDAGAGGEEPPAGGQEEWCLLLTSTICPNQGMTHTARWDPALRRDDYERAVERWLLDDERLPIVMVENAGANMASFREKKGFAEFLSFRDESVEPLRGKGHAEYRSILYAMQHSSLLARCRGIVKVTGRYFLHNFTSVLRNVTREDAQIVVQSTPSPWQMWDGVLRSEVVGFRNDFDVVQALFDNQNEAEGIPMERTLFVAVREMAQRGFRVSSFPQLEVYPTINSEHTHLITQL